MCRKWHYNYLTKSEIIITVHFKNHTDDICQSRVQPCVGSPADRICNRIGDNGRRMTRSPSRRWWSTRLLCQIEKLGYGSLFCPWSYSRIAITSHSLRRPNLWSLPWELRSAANNSFYEATATNPYAFLPFLLIFYEKLFSPPVHLYFYFYF